MNTYTRTLSFAVLLGLCFIFCGTAYGWGYNTHRLINRKAVLSLPDEMSAFKSYAEFLGDHASDLDFLKYIYTEDKNRHYMDLDMLDEYPFKNAPRDKDEAIKKFGREKLNKAGLLAWAVGEYTERLSESMKHSWWLHTAWLASVLGHYVCDACQPLHATENYNGQLTGNEGIHKRFEVEMIDRHIADLDLSTDEVVFVDDPVEFAFQILTESWKGVEPVLKADDGAKQVSDKYDNEYYEALWKRTGKLAESRLNQAVWAIASLWYTAWVKAGRPDIPPVENFTLGEQ